MSDRRPESAEYLSRIFDVSGLSVLVTGAASGLGLAFSEALGGAGATVTMADIDEGGLGSAASRLAGEGLAVRAQTVDVADRDSIGNAVAETVAAVGRLDVVFANAGISGGPGPDSADVGALEHLDWARWDKVIATNLTGVLATMQAAARPMKAQGSGRIIVTASTAALEADTSVGYAYIASKAAVGNLVRQAALELGRHGVLVSGIAPGTFRTNIAGGFVKVADNEAAFAKRVPLERIAQPDEIKGLAIFLASPAASFVSGSILTIDGGETAGWFSTEKFSDVGQA